MTVRPVEFKSEGTTVRGDLYLPEGEGPFPTVVMAGGWCYVKELRMPQYAKNFVDRGFAALIFDYRRMGASDGMPRQHIDPWDQINDYRNAITFLETLPEVDNERIGAWGISYSGGHVLILGAIDSRVKTVVSNVPVIDGYSNMWRVHGTHRFRQLKAAIAEDRRKIAATGEYETVPMSGTPKSPDDQLSTWPLDEVKETFVMLKETQAPAHEHWNTLASVDNLLTYNALPYVKRLVGTPTMMVVAINDDITLWDIELEAFNAIPTPDKEFVVLPDTSHMTLYSDLTALDFAAAAAGSWFSRHLMEPKTIQNQIGRFQQ